MIDDQYQREQCHGVIEKPGGSQLLTQQLQGWAQGVPQYEKLSQSGIREYRQPAHLNLHGS